MQSIEGNKFRDVLTGIAEDIQRILLRQSVTKPAANAISSAVGGLNFGGHILGGGGAIDGGWTSQIATAGYASGGYTGSGSRNEPAGIVSTSALSVNAEKTLLTEPGMRSHLEGLKIRTTLSIDGKFRRQLGIAKVWRRNGAGN